MTAPAFSVPTTKTAQNVPLEPLAIVVNHSNSVDKLSMAELRQIFLGERSHWPNGRRITLVMREPGDAERRAIVHDVCGMTEAQLKTHVLHGLFTSEILVSPKILTSPAGVRRFVFNVPGAIGYLRLSDIDASVKVISIDDLQPSDRDYRLRIPAQGVNQ
jgi:ABC-type phosphate transport system substrate-binding protein